MVADNSSFASVPEIGVHFAVNVISDVITVLKSNAVLALSAYQPSKV